MDALRYLWRSLLHYRFAYAGVLAGAVLGATVLLGALFASASVEASLRRIGELRIGQTTHVISGGDRFFRAALADALAVAADVRTAPVLLARGVATHTTTQASANQVQLVGVTDAFWQFAPAPAKVPLERPRSIVAINETLAQRLSLVVGDTLIVRLQKPGILAGNAPVAGAEAALKTTRCTVGAIVSDAAFGRFSLETTQIPSPTVFLPLALLQETFEQPDKANVLLVSAAPVPSRAPARSTSATTASVPSARSVSPALAQALAQVVQLADYGLSLKWLNEAGAFEIASDRIFIDPELADALTRAVPTAQPVLSYLVNEFRVGGRTTPYSIATATTPAAAPFLPADLGPHEIVLNDWLARDLAARAGDEVRLTFFQVVAAGGLVEETGTFRVRSIVPLQGLAADGAWMPEFPGITDTKDQRDWDPGLPLNLERIRDQDERYWDDFRGAPKAFLSLGGGRALWSTRWGNTTALRIPFAREREAELTRTVLAALRPEMNQLLLRDVRANAEASAKSPVDFGGLFLGMSFFLILAALGLVALLFQFVLLQRNREDALLAAVGVRSSTLLRWRLAEGAALLLLAGVVAVPLAAGYTRGILRFLESIWAAQSTSPTFVFAAPPTKIAAGLIAFLLCSLAAIWLAIRKRTRRALSIRLAVQAEDPTSPARVRRTSFLVLALAIALASSAIALANRGLPPQAAFYLAGFALLVAGLAGCRAWLASPAAHRGAADARTLGTLNLKARRSRSLTVVALIATAVFMVLSVTSFRKNVGRDWLERGSGTGGFAFWIETTAALNVARDGGPGGFEIFEAYARDLGEIVPLRAGTGDNANCFNLNTTAQPRLLAVDSAKLAARHAFKLRLATAEQTAAGWNALRAPQANGTLPALVDETTLLWALKRKVGDIVSYTDENGRPFEVQIVGTVADSVFQGYVLLDEQLFLQKFPSHPGYSVFLADAISASETSALRARLETSTRDVGGRIETTRDVLEAFHQIENTYIAIFSVLGSLGVLLGSLGLAIVVARNLRERRGEFAVMTAIGIPRAVLGRMVFAEFSRLVACGILIGAVASAIAVGPNITALPAAATIAWVATLLLGIIILNLASGWLIFRWSVRDLRPGVVQAAA